MPLYNTHQSFCCIVGMSGSFIAAMTQVRAVAGTTGPMLFIDNSNGDTPIRIKNIKVDANANLGESIVITVRGGMTVATLGNTNTLTPASFTAGENADINGAAFYQWNGVATGISGVTGGSGKLLDLAVISLASQRAEVGAGLIVPAGGNIGITITGAGAASCLCIVKGTVD